jgi:RNA polymerase sigma factor (sigma-70 family)
MGAVLHAVGFERRALHETQIPPPRVKKALDPCVCWVEARDEGCGMDREAQFRELFAHEGAPVMRTVYLILQDEGRAEEITQDAFVQLYRNWGKVREYDRPGAWVRRVAIRLAINSVARERRLAVALARWRPSLESGDCSDVGASVDVLSAIRQLSPKQRAAVVLFYFEDRPLAEVGEFLGCSTSTAGVHLHRARERLSHLLSEEVSSDVSR